MTPRVIRDSKHNIAETCHCEGVKPEAISAVRDCFVTSLLAMTAYVTSV